MKLIIGLGNTGEKYEKTRHNVGFMVIDAFAAKVNSTGWSLNGKLHSLLSIVKGSLILAKPTTFMNSSGITAVSLTNYYKIQTPDIWIIHDDLDIILGQYKIQKGVGPKLHYGIQSIEEKLKTKDFWRVRVGVDNRSDDNRILGEEYVLENFEKGEIEIRDRVIGEIVQKLLREVVGGM
jgi:PTH1 family peptidyl-tRNA hydrolase